jgi:hypothetical protein
MQILGLRVIQRFDRVKLHGYLLDIGHGVMGEPDSRRASQRALTQTGDDQASCPSRCSTRT